MQSCGVGAYCGGSIDAEILNGSSSAQIHAEVPRFDGSTVTEFDQSIGIADGMVTLDLNWLEYTEGIGEIRLTVTGAQQATVRVDASFCYPTCQGVHNT